MVRIFTPHKSVFDITVAEMIDYGREFTVKASTCEIFVKDTISRRVRTYLRGASINVDLMDIKDVEE